MDDFVELNRQEAAVSARFKREIYSLMTIKAKWYLPPETQVILDFVYYIIVGNQKVCISAVC